MLSPLHVGIAAWLHRATGGAGFASFPSSPVQTRLARLESAQDASDMAHVAEFSRMVNYVPREDEPARPFEDTSALWTVHARILGRMAFAERAWTGSDQTAYAAARAMLYSDGAVGFPTMTPLYRLYMDYASAHADLAAGGGSAAEIAEIMTAWILEGAKLEIEAAQATVARLAGRSTRVLVETERLQLGSMLAVDPSGMSYGMTGFAPISATRDAGWLRAEVDLSDISDAAAGMTSGTAAFDGWVRGKTGRVHFEHAVLTVHRNWFTPAIYAADDWHVPDGEEVSDGAGARGVLPAFVARVYLARDVDFRADARPAAPGARPPAPVRLRAKTGTTTLQTGSATLRPRAAAPVAPALRLAAGQVRTIALRKGPGAPTGPGVTGGSHLVPAAQRGTGKAPASSRMLTTLVRSATSPAGLRTGSSSGASVHTRVELVSSAKIQRRLALMHFKLDAKPDRTSSGARPPTPLPPSGPDRNIWAVGFDAMRLPRAPHPNPGYGWGASAPG